MRRSIEWFLGSVLVYVFVAACAAPGGIGDLVEKATGGLKSMMEGTGAIAGALGSGASNQAPNGGKAETGSGATQGEGANQGSGATQGEGASGGMSIMNPVPEADAAEDGTRIVNLYRTTADGLRAPEAFYFWDKELEVRCYFQLAEDGKERCLPVSSASVGTSYFADSGCSVPVSFVSKGICPSYAVSPTAVASCDSTSTYRYSTYEVGSKTTVVYSKSGDTCTEVNPATLDSLDFYSVTKMDTTMFAEGALVHE